jgi:hypothetical protein
MHIAHDDLIAAVLNTTGNPAPSRDAFALAHCHSLSAVPLDGPPIRILGGGECGAILLGACVFYEASRSPAEQQWLITRELARWALREWELPETDDAIDYIAARIVVT